MRGWDSLRYYLRGWDSLRYYAMKPVKSPLII